MPSLKLINREIKKIEPPAVGQVLYWDPDVAGFGLRVTASKMTFVAKGRVKGKAQPRWVAIGAYPKWTPEQARDEAKKALQKMESGIDPVEQAAAEKIKSRTLSDVFNDYIDRKKLKPNTEKVYRHSFNLGLCDWGKRGLDQITRDDVETRYDKICQGWRATEVQHTRGAGEALASQIMRLLGQLYNFENEVHDCNYTNPVKRLSHTRRGWSKSKQRQTVVLDSEMPLFYQLVMKQQFELTRDYMLLLLLTGLRAQEAAGLRWDEVNLKDGIVIISGERTKNGQPHAFPLMPVLIEIFERRSRENSSKSPFVFPGPGKTGHYVEPKTAFAYVSDELGKNITPHVLRHTFATASQALGAHERIQKKLLNHSKGDITERYIHADVEMLRKPLEQITDHFLKLMKVKQN